MNILQITRESWIDALASIPPDPMIAEASKRAAEWRDRELEKRLREAGPGHAVGVRLKPGSHLPFPREYLAQPTVELEWEFHTVELIDGAITVGLAGFHYFTLKDPK